MRYSLFSRPDIAHESTEAQLHSLLKAEGHLYDENNPEVVIFLGGDGTFLRAVQKYLQTLDQIVFVGVHFGRLGFFCDYTFDTLPKLVLDLASYQSISQTQRLLHLKTYQGSRKIQDYYAVNEVRIENPFHTLVAEVYIDEEVLENFRGNGLIVSSSLGSSGYNKSLGGALVDHSLESLQLTESASLSNNTFRSLGSSLVLCKDKVIQFKGNFKHSLLGYDHQTIPVEEDIDHIKIQLSDKTLRLINQNRRTYIQTLRKTFIHD